MRAFSLQDRFSAVIMPFRSFQHLVTVEDQMSCLGAVHHHLAPGGTLVFDVFCPDLGRLASPSIDEIEDSPDTALPDGRRFRRASRVAAVDRVHQWSAIELVYYVSDSDGRVDRRVHRFRMRWFLLFELEHLLARSGFSVRAMYGNFDSSPLVDGAPEIIVVAERQSTA